MPTIKIITVGKATPASMTLLIDEYEKRLSKWTKLEWDIVPAAKSGEQAKLISTEGKLILSRLNKDDHVVLLDERGQQFTNLQISEKLEASTNASKKLTFVIGGAYGVSQDVVKRADLIWSFSSLVFPHQMVRLMLAEQLYRAYSILNGSLYHHN